MSRCSDRRRHPVGFSPAQQARREGAEERRVSREKRSDAEQLARLLERPGHSKRERARLEAALEAARQE